MNRIKRLAAATMSVVVLSGVCVFGSGMTASAKSTGAGLAEYALNAYYEEWSYVWGGTEPGAVDCSGLIWSYCGGDRLNMLSDAKANGRDWGYVSDGIPRVHGLGLSRPNHVGVYIEDGWEVDARGSDYGVCYQQIGAGGWNNWDCWFKLTACSYPDWGWESFNGNYYYYEDGEYIVNTSRTIDGTTYYFDSDGHSSTTPSSTSSSSSGSKSSSKSSSAKKTTWRNGDSGDEVTKIQNRLAELGYYTAAVDGIFGDITEKAYRAFQTDAGVLIDGIAGSDRDVLYSDDAPYAAKPKSAEPVGAVEEDSYDDSDDESYEDTYEETNEETAEEEPEYSETASEENVSDETASDETASDETASDETASDETAEEDAAVTAEEGEYSDNVSYIQSQLAALGYFNIDATGYFGDRTVEAIKTFQFLNGLDVTGELDEATAALLFSEDAVANPNPEAEKDEQSAAMIAVPEKSEAQPVAKAPVQSANDSVSEADKAAAAVGTANKTTENALSKSTAAISAATAAKVKRSANIGLWFVLVAVILGVTAVVFIVVDRKRNRVAHAGRKRKSTRAQLKERW